jgi:hypothetical protein
VYETGYHDDAGALQPVATAHRITGPKTKPPESGGGFVFIAEHVGWKDLRADTIDIASVKMEKKLQMLAVSRIARTCLSARCRICRSPMANELAAAR